MEMKSTLLKRLGTFCKPESVIATGEKGKDVLCEQS
jgi:hypothetical protein